MQGHRERLISSGLFSPLSPEETARRNGILERVANGEKIKDIPAYCVYRSDAPYNHVVFEDAKRCKDAELIAEKLLYFEASRLCHRLNYDDPELPLTHPKSTYKQSLYKICSKGEWDIWAAQKLQMSIFDGNDKENNQ